MDEYAGRDYSHRKQWVIERLTQLAGIFSIEICAYAVMSNHYHLVLYVNRERARQWSQRTGVRCRVAGSRVRALGRGAWKSGVSKPHESVTSTLDSLLQKKRRNPRTRDPAPKRCEKAERLYVK